jgi:membrane fusion protein (multidrug efflux system)
MVAAGHLTATRIPTTLDLTATVISLREVRIQPKVSGYLEVVALRAGDAVRAGQVVAVVEHSQLDAQVGQAQQSALAAVSAVQSAQAAVAASDAQVVNATAARRRAEADLGSARAAVNKAKAQLTVSQATHTRVTSLFQQGFVSQQAVDQATADLQSAQAGVQAAEAQVGVAQAGVDQSQAQLRAAQAQQRAAASQVRTQQAQAASLAAALQSVRLAQASATIRAPFSGVVVSRSLDPGAYVSPGSGVPIMTIAELDHIAIIVNVSEASMATIRRGGAANVTVDAYPGRVFKGIVGRMAGGVDPDTRTVQVEIDLDNKDHTLRPGMYARVQLSGPPRQAYTVPLSALVIIGGQQFVWVVDQGQVYRRAVTIGTTYQSLVEITGGVSPQETIVLRGVEQLREGGPVRTGE